LAVFGDEKSLKFRTLVIAALWPEFNREAAGRDVEAEDAVTPSSWARAAMRSAENIFFNFVQPNLVQAV